MIVVADASPLIFLSKVRRLGVVRSLLGDDIRVPKQVRDEILAPRIDAVEKHELTVFLEYCTVKVVRSPRRFASAMSVADNAALTLALRCHADFLLCDERVTRLMAETEGVRPLGTLGVLLRAMRQRILSAEQTRAIVDDLVRLHHFRIGIEVYQAVVAAIDGHTTGQP